MWLYKIWFVENLIMEKKKKVKSGYNNSWNCRSWNRSRMLLFKPVGPEATCLLDTGGLSLHCCPNILCLFSTRIHEGAWICIFYPKDQLHHYAFQSKPPKQTSWADDAILIKAGVVFWCNAESPTCERSTVSSERSTVFAFSVDFHFLCIIIVIAIWYLFCRASDAAIEMITSVDLNNYLFDYHKIWHMRSLSQEDE